MNIFKDFTQTYLILKRGLLMAKTNYSYEKRGRELEKQKKKEEKRKKKLAQKNGEIQEEETQSHSDTGQDTNIEK